MNAKLTITFVLARIEQKFSAFQGIVSNYTHVTTIQSRWSIVLNFVPAKHGTTILICSIKKIKGFCTGARNNAFF